MDEMDLFGVLFVYFTEYSTEEARDRLEMLIVEAIDSDGRQHDDDEYYISPITINMAFSYANHKWFEKLPKPRQKALIAKLWKKRCERYENAQRKRKGLPPLPPSEPEHKLPDMVPEEEDMPF